MFGVLEIVRAMRTGKPLVVEKDGKRVEVLVRANMDGSLDIFMEAFGVSKSVLWSGSQIHYPAYIVKSKAISELINKDIEFFMKRISGRE